VSQLVFPCLLHATCLKLVEQADDVPCDFSIPGNIVQQVVQFTRKVGMPGIENVVELNNIIVGVKSTVRRCEKDISEIRSALKKFPTLELSKIINPFQEGDGKVFPQFIKVEEGRDSAVGKVLKELFLKSPAFNHSSDSVEFKFPKPYQRVFVLKYFPEKPSDDYYSYANLPQRMSCLIKEDEFRAAGTFSRRTDVG